MMISLRFLRSFEQKISTSISATVRALRFSLVRKFLQKYPLLLMSKRMTLFNLSLLLLTACGSDAAMYNVLGNRVGTVTESEKSFRVKDVGGETVLVMKAGIIRDQFGTRMARVRDGVITDVRGLRLGAVTKQGDCIDPDGKRLGKTVGSIDLDAKASACLMLLLQI